MIDVTVVVATFGGPEWRRLAELRAIPSAEKLCVPIVAVHGETLHGARNAGLEMVNTEWVCHLDADDELAPDYFDHFSGQADLTAPAVQYITALGPQPPVVPRVSGHTHECTGECLDDGNWMVIGTVARAEMLLTAGGWQPWPVFEDWALWRAARACGATIAAEPKATYVAHVRGGSRNRSMQPAEQRRWHDEIVRAG